MLLGFKWCGIVVVSAGLNNCEEIGGSYYGIMEFIGNVYEWVIFVGNFEGRSFIGNYGDGIIIFGGSVNVVGWLSGDIGVGYRGGFYFNLE